MIGSIHWRSLDGAVGWEEYQRVECCREILAADRWMDLLCDRVQSCKGGDSRDDVLEEGW